MLGFYFSATKFEICFKLFLETKQNFEDLYNFVSLNKIEKTVNFLNYFTIPGNLLRSGDHRGYHSMAHMYTRLATLPTVLPQ